jgi:16S rRNA A1518/A1519 N6-dimethyltransferase RsmA/KsgA/DIM1 with predicted DNA glycosylase/AP lyase activity
MDLARAHYENLLAHHYTWMLGGNLEATASSQRQVLEDLSVRPGAVAVDLGCGPGSQTLALADMGFESVIGIDTSQELLDELADHARTRPAITAINADLVQALPTHSTAAWPTSWCACATQSYTCPTETPWSSSVIGSAVRSHRRDPSRRQGLGAFEEQLPQAASGP